MKTASENNRFQTFFEQERYVVLKNYLYNYLLRKRAVERILGDDPPGLLLEVGCGLSPVMTRTRHIVYSDLSPLALGILRREQGRGHYVAADAAHLPFAAGAFSHAIASEVLEHLPDDRAALAEWARCTTPGGRVVLTFPHRKAYMGYDDRFVGHYRRYERAEMQERLEEAGLCLAEVRKVLGPLDKLASLILVRCYSWVARRPAAPAKARRRPAVSAVLAWGFRWANRVYAVPVWIEARVMPRVWATVLLVAARKPEARSGEQSG